MSAIVFLCVVMFLALPVVLGGCPAAIVGGLAAARRRLRRQPRTRVGGSVDDFSIKTNTQSAGCSDSVDANQSDITVYGGASLLTGTAPNRKFKGTSEEIAQRVPGVRAVYDEIEVGPPEGAWQGTKTLGHSRLQYRAGVQRQYPLGQLHDQTVNKSVYLIGSGRSQAELDAATTMARNYSGVSGSSPTSRSDPACRLRPALRPHPFERAASALRRCAGDCVEVEKL